MLRKAKQRPRQLKLSRKRRRPMLRLLRPANRKRQSRLPLPKKLLHHAMKELQRPKRKATKKLKPCSKRLLKASKP